MSLDVAGIPSLEHFEQDLINRWESGSETLEFAGSESICHARSCASKGGDRRNSRPNWNAEGNLVTIDQTWSDGSENSDRGQDDEQGRRARRYLPQDTDFYSISPRHSAAVVSVLRISSPTFSRVG
jgi:hypothetical protein